MPHTKQRNRFLTLWVLLGRQVRGPLDLEQWEGMEHFPVSVGDYLSNLYVKIITITDFVEEQGRLANHKYIELYDKGTKGRQII